MNIADYIKNKLPYWPNWINLLLMRFNFLGSRVYGKASENFKKNIPNIQPGQKLLEMVDFAIKNVPYYRNRYADIEIHNVDEFKEKIAFIDKNEVMAHWDDFLVDSIDWQKCVVGTTGGTSGKPLKLVQPKNRYVVESAFVSLIRGKSGWCYTPRALIRNHKLPVGRDFMLNPFTKDFMFDAFRMDERYAAKVYSIMKRYHIYYIHAYPSGAYQFLKLCHKQHLDLSFVKCCMLSSEALTDEQAHFIWNELHIPISITFGHSEKLILAGNDCKSLDYLVEPGYGFFELVNADGKAIDQIGEIGEMVGTTFYNRYMPLMRYRTGDYAVYGGVRKDSDGVEKIVLRKIYGRWDSSVIYKQDDTVTSMTALNLHGDFYTHIDGMQYVQEERGKLLVLIIKNELYTVKDEDFIMEHLGYAMGGKEYISIRYVSKLIYQPNGKFLPFISLIAKTKSNKD